VKPSEVRELLRASGLSPKKSFGQNFLAADSVIRAIAEACVPDAEVGRAEVVEIGAGLGVLTQALAARAARVTAVERDRDLIPVLERTLAEPVARGIVRISESDAQKLSWAEAFAQPGGLEVSADGRGAPRVVCGNLPYQITGPLLRLAVEGAAHLDRVVFMVQSEVADRLLAGPGEEDYGALTVFVRAAFDVRLVRRVPAGAFVPAPRVASAVVLLAPLRPPRAKETEAFRALVKAAFGTRRKTLRNAWRKILADRGELERLAAEAGISLDARGETLGVESFARLAEAIEQRPIG
jgi:16S rRNA (adenine1518-N6/adenine1519-N6)-dimethyltransferase